MQIINQHQLRGGKQGCTVDSVSNQSKTAQAGSWRHEIPFLICVPEF